MAEHPDRRPDVSDATENGRTRIRTDRGRLGDKIPVADPAAAPLGTDAEAGGAQPPAAGSHGAADGTRTSHPAGQAAGPVPTRGFAASGALWGVVGVVVAVLAVLLVVGVF